MKGDFSNNEMIIYCSLKLIKVTKWSDGVKYKSSEHEYVGENWYKSSKLRGQFFWWMGLKWNRSVSLLPDIKSGNFSHFSSLRIIVGIDKNFRLYIPFQMRGYWFN